MTQPRSTDDADLAQQATVSAAWTTLLTVVSRASQFVSQLVLAWLLVPEDFGIVGLAYTLMMFVWLLRHAGIGPVLIQRQRRIERWAGPAMWMSLVIGLAAAGLTVGLAPLVAAFYREPALVAVLWVLAASVPFESLSIVPRAVLQSQLRFKPLTMIDGGVALGSAAGAIALAASGWGVYSFVIPRLVASVIALPILWRSSGLDWRRRPAPRRWKFLAAGMGWVTAGGAALQLINQGDYIVLGRLVEEDLVGQYYLAFMISSQTMTLLTVNLGLVLMPALSRFRSEPLRQAELFMEFQRIMATVALPLCVALSVCARPLAEVALDPRWTPVGPLLEILSVGMAFRMLAVNTHHYLQAAGRWSRYFWLNVIHGVAFIVACAVALRGGSLVALAYTVSGFFVAYGITQLVASLPAEMNHRLGKTLRLYVGGLVVSGLAAAITLGLTWPLDLGPTATLGLRGVGMAVFSVLLVRGLLPDIYAGLWARLNALRHRGGASTGR
ncbi:MAG: oligosaccharide flippase family protein [Planctomycetota bacterium]